MKDGFYSKKSALGVPNALVLLMLIFFFVPFAGRGARMALQKTENNVKDWLPDSFRETEELAWFAKRFVSEQFIVSTWEGCHADDQRLKMFVSKLRSEQAPPLDADTSSALFRARKLGAEYALFENEDAHFNWGGKEEKWLVDEHGQSYYITPNGFLHRWGGNPNIVSAAWRVFARSTGSFRLDGQFIAAFGDPGTDERPNPFWENPALLTAPLFKTIETGPDLVGQLARNGGSLETPTEPKAGERDAISRLTGTMFGPPVPSGFHWKKEELSEFLTQEKLAELPEGWESVWDLVVQREVDQNYNGDLDSFLAADPVEQSACWYDFFDAINVEEPQRQTCVVLTLTEAAKRNLARVIGRGMMGQQPGRLFRIAEECGISSPPTPSTAPPPFSWLAAAPPTVEPTIHIGGPPVDNVAIDEEGTITLVRLIGYSLALGLGLSLALLRSVRLMMVVFFVGGVSAMASLSMVWWCNASVDAILLTMPSLVYVLGMAGAIHIVNYYRDAAVEGGQKGAPERAISHAFLPCSLAALTTAIGLLSLCTSNILPIRKFGIFSAMGVISTLVLLYLFLPSALTVFPPKERTLRGSGDKAAQRILGFWEVVGAFILKRHWWVNAVCITLFIGLGFGLFKIQTSVQLLKLFDSNSQIIRDYAWLEDNFGRLVPMELVVRFPEELQRPVEVSDDASADEQRLARQQLSLLDRADAVRRIQEVLQNQFGYEGENKVGRGMSAVTLIKDAPEPWEGFNPQRSGANRLLHSNFEKLLATDYIAIEDEGPAEGMELWRISLRLGALNDVDYGEFVTSLRAAVEPVVSAYRCRRQVFENILDQKTGFDDRLVGSVFVLGQSPPKANDEEEKLEREMVEFDEKGTRELPVDATKIFSDTLAQCFVSGPISQPRWHDPASLSLKQPENYERWLKILQNVDCVVLLDDHEDYDVDFIKSQNANVIDARQMFASLQTADYLYDVPVERPVEVSIRDGEMDVVYTGVVPVVYKAQRTLLISLIESVAWAFVLIAVVMMCLLSPARSFIGAFHPRNFLQSLGSGAISMIPNVFPVVVIFGLMGHWGSLVDIGSMMTASVAMGVAVDDTIHFLTWFRDGLRKGLDRREAIFVAYKHVAPAMTQTTIIGGLGLSVFALSTFTPTQRFGTLMLSLLGAALVGDLIFLPALLASPLGRIFTMRNRKPEDDTKLHSEHGHANEASEEESYSGGDDEGEYKLAAPEVPKLQIHAPKMLRQDSPHVRRRI